MASTLKHKKGFTLLELVIYISLFIVLLGGMLYSSYYLQRVLVDNAVEYNAKENIYRHLTLLQEYAKNADSIIYSSSSLKIIHKNGYVEQTLINSEIVLTFTHGQIIHSTFNPFPYMYFEVFSFKKGKRNDTFLTKSILNVVLKRKGSTHELHTLVDFLLIP